MHFYKWKFFSTFKICLVKVGSKTDSCMAIRRRKLHLKKDFIYMSRTRSYPIYVILAVGAAVMEMYAGVTHLVVTHTSGRLSVTRYRGEWPDLAPARHLQILCICISPQVDRDRGGREIVLSCYLLTENKIHYWDHIPYKQITIICIFHLFDIL